MQNRTQHCYNLLQCDHWHCSSLSVRPPWTAHPITHSLLLCWLASSVFWTDIKDSKDSAPFLSLVLQSGTISLSPCDMLKFCLPSNLSWSLTCFLSCNPVGLGSLENALSNLGNVCVCAHTCACMCVWVRVKMEGEWCWWHICVCCMWAFGVWNFACFCLIVCCTRLGLIWGGAPKDLIIIISEAVYDKTVDKQQIHSLKHLCIDLLFCTSLATSIPLSHRTSLCSTATVSVSWSLLQYLRTIQHQIQYTHLVTVARYCTAKIISL